jgi:hypothetical protein
MEAPRDASSLLALVKPKRHKPESLDWFSKAKIGRSILRDLVTHGALKDSKDILLPAW